MAMLLESEDALATGLDALAASDPVMARLIGEGARPPLRKRPAGFEGLCRIVVSQQLSTQSAAAIWARVAGRFPAIAPQDILASDEADLRALGLSAPKIKTLSAIASAVAEGRLPLDRFHAADAETAHASLVAVKGIGPWTADIYLLFCLGHPDAFAAGDLALQEGARLAYDLPARPDARALLAQAEAWRPWRGVAAKVLWAYYGLRTKTRREPPVSP